MVAGRRRRRPQGLRFGIQRFIAPWRTLFNRRLGRPSVPIDTLLRLLYLKHRYGLGYESLCCVVADSLSGGRRFCRLALDWTSPHLTILVELLRRAGPEVVNELNIALLHKLASDKLLQARNLRVDTTVVEADVDYRPTPTCWSMRSESGSSP
jgi:IS5 family transposase